MRDFIGEYHLVGYNIFHRDRVNKIGGGVILYIKESITAVQGELDLEFETLNVEIECEIKLTIMAIYRPPKHGRENDEKLFTRLGEGLGTKNVIIMGDLNCPSINWESFTAREEDMPLLNFTQDNFLTQFVREPTRGNNILDIILGTDEDLVSQVQIKCPLGTSDHNIIECKLNIKKGNEQKPVQALSFRRARWDDLRNKLEDIKLPIINNIEQIWNQYKTQFLGIQGECIPKITIHPGKEGKPAWMNLNIIKEIRRRDKLYKQYKLYPNDEEKGKLMKSKKKVKTLIRQARKQNEIDIALKSKKDPKKFYSYVKSRKPIKTNFGPIRDTDGSIQHNNKTMANVLNEYFISVLTIEDIINVPECNPIVNPTNVINDIVLTQDDIIKCIDKLNSTKAPGPDEITPRVLKEVKYSIVKDIYDIFDLSLRTGSVPKDWKLANVVPIHKKGDRACFKNYRPISLTSTLGKILETIITKQITTHLETNNLIHDSQHGFRNHRSCLTNLIEFFHHMMEKYDTNNAIDIIYLDFQKAFDKVPHRRLLSKVRALGIRGIIADWIESWLTDRKQRVVINGEASGWRTVTSGVPQGSVLGPLLFIIYINDIDINILNKISKFADDTKLGGGAENLESILSLQTDLDRVVEWAQRWQMTFNVEKCKVMHIGKNNPNFQYKMNNKILETTTLQSDLGVLISDDLKSTKQCIDVEKKCNRLLGYIRRQFHYKNKDIVITLYKALVRPYLDYAVQFWCPSYRRDIDRLERVQARATKMIPEIRGLSYQERLKKLNMNSLEVRRTKLDLIQTYKILNGVDNVDYTNYFSLNLNNTRNNGYKLHAVSYDTQRMGDFFTYRIVNMWNELPAKVVGVDSVGAFKTQLNKHFGWY